MAGAAAASLLKGGAMGTTYNIVIVVLILACVGILVYLRKNRPGGGPKQPPRGGIIR